MLNNNNLIKSVRTKRLFNELPLNYETLKGLNKKEYTHMTKVQQECIPPLLYGYDVIGVAPTGSGKTLAFLIPVLERLSKLNWQPMDGLGALIITPSRELAMQIFIVLNAIGMEHKLSAGVVCGGKSLKDERKSLAAMNIIIATPGRLVQHLSESQGFCFDNLRMLIFDEVDSLFEMGFYAQLKMILEYLPRTTAMSQEEYEESLLLGIPEAEKKIMRIQSVELIKSLQKNKYNIYHLNSKLLSTLQQKMRAVDSSNEQAGEENNNSNKKKINKAISNLKTVRDVKKMADQNPYVYFDRVRHAIEVNLSKETSEKLAKTQRFERQTAFFTATVSKKTPKLIKKLIMDAAYYENLDDNHGPVEIRILQREDMNKEQNDNTTNTSESEVDEVLPQALTNVLVEVHPADKLDIVFSFIRSHLEQKTIIFFSTCRQVSYIYEAFRRLQPGIPVLHLDGRMKQNTRQEVYFTFTKSKAAVLLATDLAARGLDFPQVQWVVQADCPPDSRTFIHRAGRAARMDRVGGNLLLVTAQEKTGMLKCLENAKITNIQQKNLSLKRAVSIRQALAMLCVKNEMLFSLAKKAISAYAKSIDVQPNKTIFPDLKDLDLVSIADSYGITGVNIHKVSVEKTQNKEDMDENETKKLTELPEKLTRFEKSQKRQNVAMLEAEKERKLLQDYLGDVSEEKQQNEDDFLKVVKVHKGALSADEKKEVAKLISDQTFRKITSGTLEEAQEYLTRDAELKGIQRHKILDEEEEEEEEINEKDMIDEKEEQTKFIEQRRKAILAEDEVDRVAYNKLIRSMKKAPKQDNSDEEEDDYLYEEEDNDEEEEETEENTNE